MSAAMTCPTCSQPQSPVRERCCPTMYEAEVAALRAERDAQAVEIEHLRNEVEILEALRLEITRAAEDQGVYQ